MKMFLVIMLDGEIYQTDTISQNDFSACEDGELTIINVQEGLACLDGKTFVPIPDAHLTDAEPVPDRPELKGLPDVQGDALAQAGLAADENNDAEADGA